MSTPTTTRHWLVYTPEYGVTISVLDDGTGPTEYQRDVVCVDGTTKREAIIAGVRALRSQQANGWLANHDGNPFAGMKAEPAYCPHGHLSCECTANECEDCEREWQAREVAK